MFKGFTIVKTSSHSTALFTILCIKLALLIQSAQRLDFQSSKSSQHLSGIPGVFPYSKTPFYLHHLPPTPSAITWILSASQAEHRAYALRQMGIFARHLLAKEWPGSHQLLWQAISVAGSSRAKLGRQDAWLLSNPQNRKGGHSRIPTKVLSLDPAQRFCWVLLGCFFSLPISHLTNLKLSASYHLEGERNVLSSPSHLSS